MLLLFICSQSPDFGPVDQQTFLGLHIAPFLSNFPKGKRTVSPLIFSERDIKLLSVLEKIYNFYFCYKFCLF